MQRRHVRRGSAGLLVAAALAVVAILPQSAHSTYPGANGLIAYSTGSGADAEIAVIEPNGTGFDELTANGVEDTAPRWSADGGTLMFERVEGDSDLWTIPAGGGAEDEITSEASHEDDGDLHPSGTKLVFESDRNQAPGDVEVYTMDLDGSNIKRLTTAGDNRDPAYSPNGKKIAFVGDRGGDEEIFVMKANGKKETPLTKNNAEDSEPEWSPNGKLIVFNTEAGADDEVYRIKASGKGVKRLTDNTADDKDPDFSPDGDLIAFHSDRDGDLDIWTMDLKGNNLFNVTNNTVDDVTPDWGAD